MTPGDALSRAQRGDLLMLPPTMVNLSFLADHRSLAGIMSVVEGLGTPDKILPKVRWRADGAIDALLMPGDAGYDELPDR